MRTARQTDGFALRQYAWISDIGLRVLGQLMVVTDMTGFIPAQLARVCMPALPKKQAGFRLIGIFPSYYRLWARARCPLAAQWEITNHRPWMAAARGRQALDTVWQAEVRAEAARGRGELAAALAFDIKKFYETVCHDKLVERAMQLDFPVVVIRAAIRAYRMARYIVLSNAVGTALATLKGVIAGCSFATSLVR